MYVCSVINLKHTHMKALLNRIDDLMEQIEMGLLTRADAMREVRNIRQSICSMYDEGSDKFMMCIDSLIDAHSMAEDI